jgi:hypothetical protein
MLPLLADTEQLIETHKGSCRELLEQILRLRWERATASRLSGLAKLLFAETERYPDLARFYYDEIHSRSQALVRRAFEMGVARGEFRALDGDSFARVAISPIVFASIWRHSFGPVVDQEFDSEAYFKTTLDILFRGIQASATSEPTRA